MVLVALVLGGYLLLSLATLALRFNGSGAFSTVPVATR